MRERGRGGESGERRKWREGEDGVERDECIEKDDKKNFFFFFYREQLISIIMHLHKNASYHGEKQNNWRQILVIARGYPFLTHSFIDGFAQVTERQDTNYHQEYL